MKIPKFNKYFSFNQRILVFFFFIKIYLYSFRRYYYKYFSLKEFYYNFDINQEVKEEY